MFKAIAICTLLSILCYGCVRSDFYQKTALVNPSEIAEIDAGKIPDSVTITAGRHYDKGFLQIVFFGKHYRKLWATPVRFPVFDMQQEHGGLRPTSLGGGFQTTSLGLKDRNGKSYVLRTIDKNPQRSLSKTLRKTFLMNVFRDQTSAANPYGPLVIPRLSEAAGIFYASPKLVYVAKNDKNLGSFSPKLEDKALMLEEKLDCRESLTLAFGNAVDIVNSETMLSDRFSDSHYQIDQQLFARCRLFDVLVGDWDRHEGQWQWAVYKHKDETIFKPIPKDRDQVFYRFKDGFFPWLLGNRFILKKFQTFSDSYGYMPGWLTNARFIDARALNEVTRDEWIMQANELKHAITDTVIAQAFKALPKPIYAQTAAVSMRRLKSRRDKLPQAAAEIYKILAKKVTVAGTDSREIFIINRLASGQTHIDVFGSDTISSPPFYSRTFNPSETKKIILHGLGGRDAFLVRGKSRSAILLKIYGGEGLDMLNNTSETKGLKKTIKAYDTKRGMDLINTRGINKEFKSKTMVHAYDREGL